MTDGAKIPNGWASSTIGEIANYINGRAFKPTEWEEAGIPIIRIQNLNNPEAKYNYSSRTFEEKYVIRNGDLLFAWAASLGAYIWRGNDAWLNQHIFRVEPKIDKQFLYFMLLNTIAEIYAKTHGSGMVHITKDKFEEISILLPPLREQKRIVAKIEELFSELDKGVEALTNARQQLATYRQSILKCAFEGKLTEEWRKRSASKIKKPTELLGEIGLHKQSQVDRLIEPEGMPILPDTWAYVRAEDLCDFITKGTTPEKSLLHAGKGDIPFIKVYNLTFSGKLDFSVAPTFIDRCTHERLLTRSKVCPNDVLMNIVGPPLGKVSIVPNLFPEWNINQAIAIFRTAFLCPILLAAYLAYEGTLRVTARKAKATAGQFNLTLEICRDIPIPVFDPVEQQVLEQRLDGELSVLASLENDLEAQLAKGETLRQAVLAKAFSGQLVAQDATDEPASALLARIRAEREELEPKKKRNGKNGKKNAA